MKRARLEQKMSKDTPSYLEAPTPPQCYDSFGIIGLPRGMRSKEVEREAMDTMQKAS
jgi:hypothetical protein